MRRGGNKDGSDRVAERGRKVGEGGEEDWEGKKDREGGTARR